MYLEDEDIICGIDPGLVNTGWGIILKKQNSINFIDSGIITSNSKISMEKRLKDIYEGLEKVISLYKPTDVAMENIFVNNNNLTSLKLGYARGVAILAIGVAKKRFFEYAPNLVKKAVVGKGKADKTQIQYMVNQILPKAKVSNEHAADALAVAICHANYRNLDLR
ncbi:MAG: crossover junction endodeoxyribonuclease RuvC [Rickettsiales bacterium]|jgi:crossover junction endodeoxyribonuclease RuvC|nr:crossover junction endodeoxyribonuclease RuvC [Rickettsiales bacterium]